MSVSEFSAITRRHIKDSIEKAINTKDTLSGINSKGIRKTLEGAKYHNSVITRESFEKLIKQFESLASPTSGNKFKLGESSKDTFISYSDLKAGSPQQKVVNNVIQALSKLDFKEFVDYIIKTYGKQVETTRGKYTGTDLETGGLKVTESIKTTKFKYYASSSKHSALILQNVPQSTMLNYLINFCIYKKLIKPKSKEVSFIQANVQAGHLAGVFNLKIANALGVEIDDKGQYYMSGLTENSPETQRIQKIVNSLFRVLADADHLSSNLSTSIKIGHISEKNLHARSGPLATTENQLSWLNERAGSALVGLSVRLANLEKEVSEARIGSLLEGFKEVISSLRKTYNSLLEADSSIAKVFRDVINNADFIEDYLNKPSSPVLTKEIGTNILSIIKTGKELPVKKVRTTVTHSIPIPGIKEIQQATKNAVKNINSMTQALEKKVSKKQSARTISITGRYSQDSRSQDNLLKLQTLLDAELVNRVKRNMVSPGLQNKSGRFAESVRVERLSESRTGMITAFYNYMKRPYQTFEPGFKQGSEKRNPKSLISKSIRELAASLVGDRLRAVRL